MTSTASNLVDSETADSNTRDLDSDASRAALPEQTSPSISLGTVVAVSDDDSRLGVRTDAWGSLHALIASQASPRPGDRVVVAMAAGGAALVIGVLRADGGPRPGADRAEADEAGLEATPAPERDVELCAPEGRVVLRARDGVVIETDADVTVSAAGRVVLTSAEGKSALRLDGDSAELRAGMFAAKAARLRWLAEELETVAVQADSQIERVHQRFGTLETEAERIVQSARTLLTRVDDLAQTRAGRIRWSAEGALHAVAGRARLVAREVFHLDGERIHLG